MFGSVPYEADKWYHVVLYFEWTHKKVLSAVCVQLAGADYAHRNWGCAAVGVFLH